MTRAPTLAGALTVGALLFGGCADGDDGGAGLASEAPPARTGTDLAVVGTDSLRFDPDTLTVPAEREVTLTFSTASGLEHDFVVEGAAGVGTAEAGEAPEDGDDAEGDLHVAHADAGQSSEAAFRIDEPGMYTVFCSVPGHREGGMVATLTVQEAS
jgi:uncharacterized cupredoxin-like copper-binding protein